MLRIGELAERAQISVETIRYYEKEGLLKADCRADNGYRYFSEDTAARLTFIRHAKQLGFSLATIAELLSLNSAREEHSCAEIKTIAGNKLEQIEQKIQQLNQLKEALQSIYSSCEGGSAPATQCRILEALSAPQADLGLDSNS